MKEWKNSSCITADNILEETRDFGMALKDVVPVEGSWRHGTSFYGGIHGSTATIFRDSICGGTNPHMKDSLRGKPGKGVYPGKHYKQWTS